MKNRMTRNPVDLPFVLRYDRSGSLTECATVICDCYSGLDGFLAVLCHGKIPLLFTVY